MLTKGDVADLDGWVVFDAALGVLGGAVPLSGTLLGSYASTRSHQQSVQRLNSGGCLTVFLAILQKG